MCYKELPQGYDYLDKIDLKNNKKQFWLVQGMGLGIMVLTIVAGCFIVNPYRALTDEPSLDVFLSISVMAVGYIAYIVFHELTHGVFMYAFVRKKLIFGASFSYAYCGSTAYFDKKHYIVIALAPVVVWGAVFGILTVFFHSGVWFWTIWLIQAGNLGGAAGDFFCTYKMCRYPKDILVQDTGTSMTVFCRKSGDELAPAEETQREEDV